MNPKHRQRYLFGALALIGVAFVADKGYQQFVAEPFELEQRTNDQLRENMRDAKLQLAQAKKDARELVGLRTQSLPSDLELARSRYQSWLLEMVKEIGLEGPNVNAGEPADFRGLHSKLSFTVRGRGTLAQITKFLHSFYSAGHLQRIRSMSLVPRGNRSLIDLTVSIQAISLPGAKSSDRLSGDVSDRLAFSQFSDYTPLVRRNIFGLGRGNVVRRAVMLTAITTGSRGKAQAWFSNEMDSQTKIVGPGDRLQFESIDLRVVQLAVDLNRLVIEMDGTTWSLKLGQTLAEAQSVTVSEELAETGRAG